MRNLCAESPVLRPFHKDIDDVNIPNSCDAVLSLGDLWPEGLLKTMRQTPNCVSTKQILPPGQWSR